MKEVFISYGSKDQTYAEMVCNVLERNGFDCWIAHRDIPGGSNYTKEIPVAIRNCTVFVLILSKYAQASPWVLKELDAAVNCGKVVLPFMLEDFVLNDEFNFLLTGAQRYAAYQKKAEAMEALISRLRGILGVESPINTQEHEEHEHSEEQLTDHVKEHTDDLLCPVCEGTDLKHLPRRILYRGIREWLTLLWIPLMMLISDILAVLVWVIFLGDFDLEALSILMLCGLIGGFFWGRAITRKAIRFMHFQRKVSCSTYRCNRCRKVFRHEAPLKIE